MLKPELQFLLPQVTALNSRTYAAFSRVVGIHLSRFRVLYLLHVLGESSPGTLLRWTVTDAAALTRVMNDFEAQGLIARRSDPEDARCRLVSLTTEGAARVQTLLQARDRMVENALTGFTAEELMTLAALMSRVEANVSKLAGLPPIGDSLNIDPARPSE